MHLRISSLIRYRIRPLVCTQRRPVSKQWMRVFLATPEVLLHYRWCSALFSGFLIMQGKFHPFPAMIGKAAIIMVGQGIRGFPGGQLGCWTRKWWGQNLDILVENIWLICAGETRDHFVNAPSQWETTLQCHIISHWLSTFTKWSLTNHYTHPPIWSLSESIVCHMLW